MQIKWIGSPNFGLPRGTKGRGPYRPIAIVYHIVAGTLSGTDSWFQNPDSMVSAHYGIGTNGEIHQYVAEEDIAWHAGNVRNPSWSLLNAYPNVNPNRFTVGIEHEGKPGQFFSEEMFLASLSLTLKILARWNIPADPNHLVGHYRIDSVDKANCPGSSFPWNRLFSFLGPKTGSPLWKQKGVEWMQENGLITADWDPEAIVDMGTLGTILSRIKDAFDTPDF